MKLYLESKQELYKLDMSLEYEIEGDIEYEVDYDLVLNAVGEYIEDKINDNKDFICKDNSFRDFSVEFVSSKADNIITFDVVFDKKIVGKYFVDKVATLLKLAILVVDYQGEDIEVRIKKVLPMLRYIGEI